MGYLDVSVAFPHVAFSYIGIEACVLAAFEARPPKSIAWPSRTIHLVTFLLYLLCTIAIALNVPWDHVNLPRLKDPRDTSSGTQMGAPLSTLASKSAVIIGVFEAEGPHAAGIVNGFLLFSILSAANTSVYFGSRILYGLTYRSRGRNVISRQFLQIGKVWKITWVPAMALFSSVVAFYWLPWLRLEESVPIDDVSPQLVTHEIALTSACQKVAKILSDTASISCLVVWASLCLAFWRY